MSSFDPKPKPNPSSEPRPLWEDDEAAPRPQPAPMAEPPRRAPEPPRTIGSSNGRALPRVLTGALKSAARRTGSELVGVGRATIGHSRDLVVHAALSSYAGVSSMLARRAQLKLGRKAAGTARPQPSGESPGWKTAELEGIALQRGAAILERGSVPAGLEMEYGRAVAAQARLDRSRRARNLAKAKVQSGGRARWIRFAVGVVILGAILVLIFAPRAS